MKNIILLYAIVAFVVAPPLKEKPEELQDPDEDWAMDVEYGRYLKEIIQTLEGDGEFRRKLEGANPDDIKSGKIANDLDFVGHNVRTKLDEIKLREVERLQKLTVMEYAQKGDKSGYQPPAAHLDHRIPHKFEAEDLRKLILKFNHDLEEVDKQRQNNYKNYKLEKKYQYEEKLKSLNESEKKAFQEKHENEIKKHKDHPKLHHPGSKSQLEEVWEEQDHLNKEDFDARNFFQLHDLDGNGYWDELEVESLFKNELDKMYDPNAPEDDLKERYEEMERMREHVLRETDLDKDKLISFDEFVMQSDKTDFNRDEGWQGLDEQEVYSEQEYNRFEQERIAEMQRLVESGAIPPPPGYHGLQPPEPHAAFNAPPDPLAGGNYQGLSHHDNPPVVETNHIAQPNLKHQNDPLAAQQANPSQHQYQQKQPNSQQGQFQQQPHIQQGQFKQSAHVQQQGQFQQPPHAQQGQFQQPPHVQQGQFQQPPHAQQGQFQQPPHVQQGQFQQQKLNVQ